MSPRMPMIRGTRPERYIRYAISVVLTPRTKLGPTRNVQSCTATRLWPAATSDAAGGRRARRRAGRLGVLEEQRRGRRGVRGARGGARGDGAAPVRVGGRGVHAPAQAGRTARGEAEVRVVDGPQAAPSFESVLT